MANLNNVEVFAVGTWNKYKFVYEDLVEIVNNTNYLISTKKLNPPLKVGHSTNQILKQQTDGDPRLGSVSNFRLNKDKKIVCDFTNIPDIIFTAIKKGLYNNVSVELDHIANFGWYTHKVALLGADLPAVKNIKDLQVYLSENQNLVDIDCKFNFSTPKIIGGVIKMSEKEKEAGGVTVNLHRDEVIEGELKEIKAKFAENLKESKKTDDKLKDIEQKMKDAEKKLEEYKSKDLERAFKEQSQKILEKYKKATKEGKLQPVLYNEIETHINSQKAAFSETTKLQMSPELVVKMMDSFSGMSTKKEEARGSKKDSEGNSDNSADEKLLVEVKKVQASSGLKYSEALDIVCNIKPELFKEYIEYTNKVSDLGRRAL
jgi:hypothetical protein